MPEKMDKNPFKIFVGNIPLEAKEPELKELFQKYGTVIEANIVRNYAFVHMENDDEGKEAIRNINSTVWHGSRLKCEQAVSRKQEESNSVKLFVGNLSEETKKEDIRKLFENYGNVLEIDIIRNYGFVHIEPSVEISTIVRDLHLKQVDGQSIKVQLSTSRVRQKPGMGSSEQCYRCGRVGHWSRECPKLSAIDRLRLSRDPYPPQPLVGQYGRDRYPPPPMANRYDEYDYPQYYDRYEEPYDMYERRPSSYPKPIGGGSGSAGGSGGGGAGVGGDYKMSQHSYGGSNRRDGPSMSGGYNRRSPPPPPAYSRTPSGYLYGSHAAAPNTASRRYAPY